MSEKQLIPFYLDLDPCESAIWVFELDILLIEVWSRFESLGVLPKMAYTRRLHPKGYHFQASSVWEGLAFTCWSIWKGLQIHYTAVKRSAFVTLSYFKDSVFTAVKRDAKFQTRHVKGV